MTTHKIIYLIIAVVAFLLSSCGDKPQRPAPALNPNQVVQDPVQTTPANSGTVAATVHHYICPNNCAGSGGPDGGASCPVCGSQYIHNQAFHNQTQQPGIQTTTTQPTTAEPAQNAAGVWHYTCPNGHAGGAGSATACAECGATLVHNTLYHQ